VLELDFDLGLEAGRKPSRVLAAYLPSRRKKWTLKKGPNRGFRVEFFPFLVVLQAGRTSYRWLPYWHVLTKGDTRKTKYGQWAPLLRQHMFDSLLEKARADGY